MAAIGVGHFGKSIWPGIYDWWGKKYAEHKPEYPELFEMHKSNKHYEEDVGVTSFGLFQVKAEGAPVTFDSERQTFVTRYTHIEYALGFIVTRIAFKDDLYGVIGQRRAQGLAFSMRQTVETVCANVYNRAFNSSFTGGDGKELLATDHPNWAGGTWANELATASDMSEAALEQACIDIMKLQNDRGLRISVIPQKLIIPVDLVYEVERILGSTNRVGTANNDINALRAMGKFPQGVVANHYLTDTDAWFIRTNTPVGMKMYEREPDRFDMDGDWDTDNAKYKGVMRFSVGWTDPRQLFGSPGA